MTASSFSPGCGSFWMARPLARCLPVWIMLAVGCSTPTTPSGTYSGDISEDGSAALGADGDATAAADSTTSQDTAVLIDSSGPDQTIGADSEPEQDIDWSELLDPVEDTVAADVDLGAPVGQLYAETATELWRLDLAAKTFTLVGKWSFDKNADDVTDIALDESGVLYAVGHKDLFSCNVDTAKCTWLVSLGQEFNGLTFVPKGTVDPQVDTLIGIAQSGDWTKITFSGTKVTLKILGSYGGKWLSSGDAFSVDGIGTFATLKTASSTSDTLVSVDPKTGKIIKFIGDTGVAKLFGLAWWSGVFYGFSTDGNVYTLDVTTGKATPVKGIKTPAGAKWWGAGVSTRAAGKLSGT